MNAPLIGQAIKRKEDPRFLTGGGQFTDDVTLPRQAHACFLRSPHAHARIRSMDLERARSAPGVIAVFTGDDLAKAKGGGLRCGWLMTRGDGTSLKSTTHQP